MKKILPLLLTSSILMSAITSVQASDEKTYDDPNGYIFTYIENSNGITLKSCKNNGNSDLVIPKQIDGKTITAIGPCIFDKGFKSLTIEADVKEYSEYMVRDDSDLQIVVLNEGLKNLGEGNFTECKSLKSITLPDSLEEIGTGSLNGCPKLKSIRIPDSVDKIGDFVLCYCPVLSELEWDMTASECSNTFAEDTPWVREYGETHEWLMINNDSVILRYIGKGGNITIPSGVTIKDGACADNDEITGAVIDSPIPDNMFLRCPNLKSAVINTDDIGKNAFKECTSLSEVSMSDNIKIINVGAFIKCTAFSYSAHARPAEPVESTPPPTTAPTALPTMKPESTQKPVNTISPTTVPVQATKALTVQTSDTGLTISTDNEQIAFDDAQPFIDENGRTQIPIRAVAEALDCVVDWDGESQTVTLSKDNTTVLIKIGNANMQVGKNIVTMDTTAQIVNDRTYIPVRFVGEALGMKVNWIGE